ncbi:MAG: fibronectin type III domain-containing protein [Actinomycetales bacterium]|nr:fibronectin type III domain-containing protein [Actinomycetales bacterium]
MRQRLTRLVATATLASALVGVLGVTSATASGPAPKLVARAASGMVTLTWSEAGAVEGYVVEQSDNGTTFAMAGVVTAGTSYVRHHLTNGHTYYFLVIAEMKGGGTNTSTIVVATPVGAPPAPTHVTSQVRSSSALVTFATPSGDGGDPILAFQVTSTPGARHCSVATTPAQRVEVPRPGTVFSCVVRGLRNGLRYRFSVRARSRAGWSRPSALSTPAQPGRRPSAPSAVTAVPQDQSAIVSWHPSFGGGAAITRYTVTSSPGGLTCVASGTTGPATTCTVTGLTNSIPYTFSVTATNAVGTSAPSSPSAPTTPLPVQSAPMGPFATGSAALSSAMSAQIAALAQSIEASGAQYVALVGYADATTTSGANALGEQRAQAVDDALTPLLQGSGVTVTIAVSSGAMPSDPADASSVVVSVS